MLTMALKPRRDGSTAVVEHGKVLWCLESEKDSFPQDTQLTPLPSNRPCCQEKELAQASVEDFPDPYMLYFRRLRLPRLTAVVHVDASASAQSVSASTNPQLHDLHSACATQTGLGTRCDTSLNLTRCGSINGMSDLVRFGESTGINDMVVGDQWYRQH